MATARRRRKATHEAQVLAALRGVLLTLAAQEEAEITIHGRTVKFRDPKRVQAMIDKYQAIVAAQKEIERDLPAFHAMACDPYQETALQIRSNLLIAKGQGRAQHLPVRLDLRGWFSSAKEGTFKQGESAQSEYKLEVHALKLEIDGKEIKEVDIDNYIWRVNGLDILADYRRNLGIS